jgi:transposase
MDTVNKIKRAYKQTGKINSAAKIGQCSWATAKKVIDASPEQLSQRGTRNTVSKLITDEVTEAIEKILRDEDEKKVHWKQKHKTPAILVKLKQAGIYHGSLRHLKRTVAEIRKKHGQSSSPPKSFLELNFENGKYLQFDHGEVEFELNKVRVKGYIFVASVPGPAIRYCQVYLTKAQEAWGKFHDDCFHFFNGVFPYCVYDNDGAICIPGKGVSNEFLSDVENYYNFEAIFCNKASGWEKGSVENAVGYCRRNFLPGLPSFESLNNLNDYLKMCSHQDRGGNHYKEDVSKEFLFEDMSKNFHPLPASKKWEKIAFLKVSSLQTVRYDSFQYSVPERFVGSNLKALISVDTISLFSEEEKVYEHQRFYYEKIDALIFEHYLDQLSRKPGAFKFAKVVHCTSFSSELTEIKERLETKLDERQAIKEFIQILLLKRVTPHEIFDLAIKMALSYGGINSNAISLIIKQLEIGERIHDCPDALLPEHLLVHKMKDYDLKIYQQLLPTGGIE